MVGKIIPITDVKEISKRLHTKNHRIVLVGGCFDLLHVGHISFLEEAKKRGNALVVLLESDETISAKGPNRPINTQKDRARILAALTAIDYIILLKPHMTNQDYDNLVFTLKPAIIATTSGDSNRHHKERQANLIGAHVIDVTMPISDKSTTRLVQLLDEL